MHCVTRCLRCLPCVTRYSVWRHGCFIEIPEIPCGKITFPHWTVNWFTGKEKSSWCSLETLKLVFNAYCEDHGSCPNNISVALIVVYVDIYIYIYVCVCVCVRAYVCVFVCVCVCGGGGGGGGGGCIISVSYRQNMPISQFLTITFAD